MAERIYYKDNLFRVRPPAHHPMEDDSRRDNFENVPHGGVSSEGRVPGERLSDQRIDELVSGVLNSEAKMLVLAGMVFRPGAYSAEALDEMVHDMQRGHDGWLPSKLRGYLYCADSFEGVGLVAKAELTENQTRYNFTATERGKDALPIVGHLLDYSLRHEDIPLQRVLSITASPGGRDLDDPEEPGDFIPRAPKKRLRILSTLLRAQEPLTELEIRRAIGTDHPVSDHLKSLSNIGLIEYRSPNLDTDVFRYTFQSEAFQDLDQIPNNEKVTDILIPSRINFILSKTNGEVTTSSIYAALTALFPHYADRDEKSVKRKIILQLNHLARNGFVEKVDGNTRTGASLNDEQREHVSELIQLIDQFQEGDPEFLAAGERRAREIFYDPSAAASLMRKAQKHSFRALSPGVEAHKDNLLAFVRVSDKPISSLDAAAALDYRIGRSHAARLLGELQREGKLQISKEGQGYWYTLADTEVGGTNQDQSITLERESSRVVRRRNIVVMRRQIEAFRELGVTSHLEIAKWIGIRSAYVRRQIDIMDDMEHSYLTDEKIERIRAAQDLRRTEGLDSEIIAERLGILPITVERYLAIADSGVLDRQQPKETASDRGKALLRGLELTFSVDTPIGERVRIAMESTGMSEGTIWAWRSELFGTPAERISARHESVRAIIAEAPEMAQKDHVDAIVQALGIDRATAYAAYESVTGAGAKRKQEVADRRAYVARRWETLAGVPFVERGRIIAGEIEKPYSTVINDYRWIKRQRSAQDMVQPDDEVVVFTADAQPPVVRVRETITARENARKGHKRGPGPTKSK